MEHLGNTMMRGESLTGRPSRDPEYVSEDHSALLRSRLARAFAVVNAVISGLQVRHACATRPQIVANGLILQA